MVPRFPLRSPGMARRYGGQTEADVATEASGVPTDVPTGVSCGGANGEPCRLRLATVPFERLR